MPFIVRVCTALLPLGVIIQFNLFIKQKDRSASYIDMHEILVETLKYTIYIKDNNK